jgi:Fe-S-cluster-containing dehydrogenase component
MEVSRRDFIKIGGVGLLGGIIIPGNTLNKLWGLAPPDAAQQVRLYRHYLEGHYWRFIVDIRKCIGCGRCVKACKLENDVPLEPECNRTWVERYVISETEEIFVDSPNAGIDGFTPDYLNTKYKNIDIRKTFFTPKLCNQCQSPPCVQVCPVGATHSTEEGVVLVDRKACVGCKYCIQACPYGARFLDHRLGVVDKCTWCYHRITKGMPPACVEVCPVGARSFGDIRDPQNPVGKMLEEETMGVLKPSLGTEPMVYYIALEKGVR